jgi:hypothetical protein
MVHPDSEFSAIVWRYPHVVERVTPIFRESGSNDGREKTFHQTVNGILMRALSHALRRGFCYHSPSTVSFCSRIGTLQYPAMKRTPITIQTAVTEFVCHNPSVHPDAMDVFKR